MDWKKILVSIVWVFLLLLIGIPVAGFCSFPNIIFQILATAFPVLKFIEDLLERGFHLPGKWTGNVCSSAALAVASL